MTRSRITGNVAHRRDGDRLVSAERRHPGHAQQPRPAVDLGAARAALAGLAVPPHRQVAGLGGLQPVDDVEHHLALVHLDRVVLQFAAVGVAAPHPELRVIVRSCPASRCRPATGCPSSAIPRRSGTSPARPARTGEQVRPHRRHRLLDDRESSAARRRASRSAAACRHSALMLGIVVPGVPAAALLADQRRRGDALADQQHVAQVQRQVPARVELPVALDADRGDPRLERVEPLAAPAGSRPPCG